MNKCIAIIAALAAVWMSWDRTPATGDATRSVRATSVPVPKAMSATVAQPATVADIHAPDHSPRNDFKYFFLLHDVRLNADGRNRILALLAERENVGNDFELPTRAETLAQVDAEIRLLLHPSDFATFQSLKDADEPLRQLHDFANGIAEVAPLSDSQTRALATAKLQSLRAHALAEAEPLHTGSELQRALLAARDEYLEMARAVLTADQFASLAAYETTEYELALLAAANGAIAPTAD